MSQTSETGSSGLQPGTGAEPHTFGPDPIGPRISLLGLMNIILRHRKTGIISAVSWIVLVIGYTLMFGEQTAYESFAPGLGQAASSSSLGAIAAQFGVSIGSVTGPPVDFYAALVTSRGVLNDLALTTYRVPNGRDTLKGNYLDLNAIDKGDPPNARLMAAYKLLLKKVGVTTDEASGIIAVNVTTKWSSLSEAMARRLLDIINEFNVEKRQSQASDELRFVDRRVDSAGTELQHARDTMTRFLEDNRSFQSSPRLIFEQQKLQADIDLKNQIYTTLEQDKEQARIAQVRDTPVITELDSPEGSSQPSPGLIMVAITSIAGAFVVGVCATFVHAYFARIRREHPEDYGEFRQQLSRVLRAIDPRRLRDRWRARRAAKAALR